ncbi:MAG: phosphopentomutase [Deltaproteobacteria bacterium GWC2_42_11]|nr:MAG: phosphopentomutase [Deltaproteobacteria bacterium GWC2_42_11]HBO84139.1 phosphopentomutase [Deltaproteobacteria bacterium]
MYNNLNRIIIIVLDSLGIGELPDAEYYGDKGSNTLGNIVKTIRWFSIPNLESLGIGNIKGVEGLKRTSSPLASYGRMMAASKGKDTATGHWEIAGIILDKPFPTYPHGFSEEIMKRFKTETGMDYIGNIAASGTEIIQKFGEEHIKTKKLIVYTSADSVFQIAAHEAVIPGERLYEVCKITRRILDDYGVCRVIARPFEGSAGSFKRTAQRKDFSIAPTGETVLDKLKAIGLPVIGIGKIGDIYGHRGLTGEIHIRDNMDGIDKTIDAIKHTDRGLLFTNLVDFDMLYGHRNDAEGYAKSLMEFDARLPGITALFKDSDMLIITADHGCDPTTPSTDHSREYVPLLVYGKGLKGGIDMGTRETFADVGQTIANVFGLQEMQNGESFLKQLL